MQTYQEANKLFQEKTPEKLEIALAIRLRWVLKEPLGKIASDYGIPSDALQRDVIERGYSELFGLTSH